METTYVSIGNLTFKVLNLEKLFKLFVILSTTGAITRMNLTLISETHKVLTITTLLLLFRPLIVSN